MQKPHTEMKHLKIGEQRIARIPGTNTISNNSLNRDLVHYSW